MTDEPADHTAAHAFSLALAAVNNSQSALARVCGCTQGAIWQMLNRKHPRLSHRYVLKVEAATGVPRHLLRPDIYPSPEQDRVLSAVA